MEAIGQLAHSDVGVQLPVLLELSTALIRLGFVFSDDILAGIVRDAAKTRTAFAWLEWLLSKEGGVIVTRPLMDLALSRADEYPSSLPPLVRLLGTGLLRQSHCSLKGRLQAGAGHEDSLGTNAFVMHSVMEAHKQGHMSTAEVQALLQVRSLSLLSLESLLLL
jgi:hypothetical protein